MEAHEAQALDFQRVGPHQMRIEEPDTLHIRLYGVVEREHFEIFFRTIMDAVPPPTPLYVLRDARNGGEVTAQARRFIARQVDIARVAAIVTFGASFHGRTIITMLNKAMRLFNKNAPTVVFFDSEAEARAWIATHRNRSSLTPLATP